MKVHEKFSVTVIERGKRQSKQVRVPLELPVTIFLNDEQLLTILATPVRLKELALGFLHSEGVIETLSELKKVTVDSRKGLVWVETEGKTLAGELLHNRLLTSGCGRGASFYDVGRVKRLVSREKVPPGVISRLMQIFLRQATLKRKVGGIHHTALADENGIICLSEDIGRHNALDKVLGECFLSQIEVRDKLVLTTGRISSEMLVKVAREGIPIMVARSSATSLAVNLGEKLNVTVIGYVRTGRMTIYTHPKRID